MCSAFVFTSLPLLHQTPPYSHSRKTNRQRRWADFHHFRKLGDACSTDMHILKQKNSHPVNSLRMRNSSKYNRAYQSNSKANRPQSL